MEKYKDIVQHIFSNKQIWEYSEGLKVEISKLPEKKNEYIDFVNQYFTAAGKGHNNELSSVLDKLEEKRLKHIVYLFFLGISSYEKSSEIRDAIDAYLAKPKYETAFESYQKNKFAYVWFLICLSHDLGYATEEYKPKMYDDYIEFEKNVTNGYKMMAPDGVPNFYKDLLKNYFDYRSKEMRCNDHGIVSGIMMYQTLSDIRKKKKEEPGCEKNKWIEDLQVLYNLSAWIVCCHNMFFANTDKVCDVCKYSRYHMHQLIKEPSEHPISFKKYPLFFLFCLLDSIESTKEIEAGEDKLSFEFDENEIWVSFNCSEESECNRMKGRIQGLKDWLTDVELKDGIYHIKLA